MKTSRKQNVTLVYHSSVYLTMYHTPEAIVYIFFGPVLTFCIWNLVGPLSDSLKMVFPLEAKFYSFTETSSRTAFVICGAVFVISSYFFVVFPPWSKSHKKWTWGFPNIILALERAAVMIQISFVWFKILWQELLVWPLWSLGGPSGSIWALFRRVFCWKVLFVLGLWQRFLQKGHHISAFCALWGFLQFSNLSSSGNFQTYPLWRCFYLFHICTTIVCSAEIIW